MHNMLYYNIDYAFFKISNTGDALFLSIKYEKFNILDLSDEEYQNFYSLMDDMRKQKVDILANEKNKKQTVAGEMLAKKTISNYLNISYDSIKIIEAENGKPFAENLDIHFNISHSDNIVVCAISETEIGIDIEKLRPINLKVAKRFCSCEELNYIFGFSPCDKDFCFTENTEILTRFFEIYTKKESVVKYNGNGISDLKNAKISDKTKTFYEDGFIISISE